MESNHDHILNGFQLNSDMLLEMRQLLERRPRTKFSDGLSDEAKLVIRELKEESRISNLSNNIPNISFDYSADRRSSKTKPPKTKTKSNVSRTKHQVTYVESLRNSTLRMGRDITDPNFSETNQRKRALGGGHVESALETVEIVNAAYPEEDAEDDFAIEETAKHNSVEKCIVWMEVNGNEEDDLDSICGAVAE